MEKKIQLDEKKNVLVCLCGGFGTRLRGHYNGPKVLAPIYVEREPAIVSIYEWAFQTGFRHIYFVAGHQGQKVKEFCDTNFETKYCTVLIEREPSGTGAAIKQFSDYFPSNFFVLNGDTIFSHSFQSILKEIKGECIVGSEIENVDRFGSLHVKDGKVLSFNEKVQTNTRGFVSSGLVYLSKQIIKSINGNSLEKDFFPILAEQKRLNFVQHKGHFFDYGTIDSYRFINGIHKKDFVKYSL